MSEIINVFFSYSHDSEAHSAWVKKLAAQLHTIHGLEVTIDAWQLRFGDDLGFFMEQGLSNAKYVLCICSEEYVHKANNGIGGVGYEKMIITQDLMTSANSNYIIPIIRNNTLPHKTPTCLDSKFYIDFSDDDKYLDSYKALLNRLYDQDIAKIPQRGENPFTKSQSDKVAIQKAVESILYYEQGYQGRIHFKYDNNNGIFKIGTGEYTFDTQWSQAGNDSIYAYGLIGFNSEFQDFPDINELEQFNFSSSSLTIHKGQIVIWENSFNNFVAVKVISVKSSNHGYPNDEMEFEYRIYGMD